MAPLSDETRRLLALLTLRRDEFSDLRTVAEVTVRRGSGIQRFTGVLLVKPPASLRFEALAPFGQPILLLTVSEGMLRTYSVAANTAFSGPVNAWTTERWLGVPLDSEDIVGLLIGRVIPSRGTREAEILPPDADGPSLRLVGDHQRERIWMDFDTGEVHKAEIGGGGRTLVVTYAHAPRAEVPSEIHATAGTDFDATVHYRQPLVATGLDPERFELRLPEGANVQRFH